MDIKAVSAINPEHMTPDEARALIELVFDLQAQYEDAQAKLGWAMEQINSLNRRLYAPKREKNTASNKDNISLFDLYPGTAPDAAPDPEAAPDSGSKPKAARPRRRKTAEGTKRFPDDIPRIEIVHDLAEEDRSCPLCGGIMSRIGERVFERLRLIPARVEIERHIVVTYSCVPCSRTEPEAIILQTPTAPNVIPGSFATPQAVAWLAVEKFLMASPLYRLEQRLASDGIPLSRQTMANWLIKSSELCLQPVLGRMHELLAGYDIVHADETELQVLREPGREPTSKSYMWVYATGTGFPHPIILYDYAPGRGGCWPEAFLKDFSGYLQTDGYDGYNAVSGAVRVACAAHMRRRFHDAMMTLPAIARADSLAAYGLDQFDDLFALEQDFKGLPYDARKTAREQYVLPKIDHLEDWLKRQNVLKNKLGSAIDYALEQMPRLRRYLDDGRLELSNNYAERCVKPFTIGRKNWLFANTPDGARASGAFYSIIATAKANGVDPYRYLVWLFTELPKCLDPDAACLDAFLPWNAPEETQSRVSPASGQAS